MTHCHPLIAAPMLAAAGQDPARRGGPAVHAANAAPARIAGELPVLRDFSAHARGAGPPLPRDCRSRFSCHPPAK